jgi:3-oxoadipate enol-lactonase
MNHTWLASETRLSYFCRDRGTDQTVLFLHPTPLDHDYWLPLAERLPGIRAIAPDLRGHGASQLAPESGLGLGLPTGAFPLVPDAPVLSIARYAEDVIALMDHLAIEKAIFAGCSIGGYILLELWRRIPQRMKGLAFVCSKPQPDSDAGRTKRAETIAKARSGGLAGIFDGMAQSLTGATARQREPQIVAEVRSMMTLSPEALVAVQAGLATRPDSRSTVASITVPVLAIAGGEDGAVTPAEMEAFKAAPGGCEFHLLETAGHFAAYEQPDRVAEIFSAWLMQDRLA